MIDGPSRRFTLYKWGWGLGAAGLQSAIYFLIGNARFARTPDGVAVAAFFDPTF